MLALAKVRDTASWGTAFAARDSRAKIVRNECVPTTAPHTEPVSTEPAFATKGKKVLNEFGELVNW